MTAKVGLSSVSYGIGVQNRYSAFLDDEDGFKLSPSMTLAAAAKHRNNQQEQQILTGAKQVKSSANSNHKLSAISSAKSANPKSAPLSSAPANKHEPQPQRASQSAGEHSQKRTSDSRRPRYQQQQPGPYDSNAQNAVRPKFFNKQQSANSNQTSRFATRQINADHQTNNSTDTNKENGAVDNGPRSARSNNFSQRNNRRRFDDKKLVSSNQAVEESNAVAQSDEEKRRRQQKRALDLKYKDPEKKEARRQQAAATIENNNSDQNAQGQAGSSEDGASPKAPRNRRQVNGDRAEVQNGPVRGLRRNQNGLEAEGANVDGNRADRRPGNQARFNGDRPARNRNGFGSGSRGSRGARGDEQPRFAGRGDSDKQKQIPNFSDKLAFPSLAS